MNNICWVTGFSKDYYNNIGQHTLKTWKYLKEDKIFLCEMDPALVKLDAYKIDIRNELKNYYPELQKDIHTRAKKAYKFFKKAYCIWYALEHYSKEYDYIIWIDTDSVIQQPINLKDLLPNSNQMFSTIIRGENACDSGFIVFNTKHNNFENFKNEYIDYYISGKIWNMHKPWDAYVLEDFSKRIEIKNLYTGILSPDSCGFEDTIVWDYIHHYWGKKRKIELGKLKNEI